MIDHALEAALEQRRQHHLRQLFARVAERVDAGVVGVLHRAVGARDQNQVAGLLGRGGEQAHARVGALQRVALHRQPQREHAEAGDHRQRGQQQAHRVSGVANRLQAQQAETDQRDQEHRRRGERRRPPAGSHRPVVGAVAGGRRFERRPGVAEERHDPGEVVDAAFVVAEARNRVARHQPQEEPCRRPHRQRDVGAAPRRLPREPDAGGKAHDHDQPLQLHEDEQRRLRRRAGDRHHAGHHHEVGEQEPEQQPVADEIDAGRERGGLARPEIRAGKERDDRPDAAAQAEHRVPLDPRSFRGQRVDGEPDLADEPHRHPDANGVPEQALRSLPVLPTPEHGPAHGPREAEEERVRDQHPRGRVRTERHARPQIDRDVQDPEQQVSQRVLKCGEGSL